MTGYLLDTNHLGAAVRRVSTVRDQINQRKRQGQRFGTCVPVLCELEAGFRQLTRPEVHRQTLAASRQGMAAGA
jgi:predicted nucleic acid-binding protein